MLYVFKMMYSDLIVDCILLVHFIIKYCFIKSHALFFLYLGVVFGVYD